MLCWHNAKNNSLNWRDTFWLNVRGVTGNAVDYLVYLEWWWSLVNSYRLGKGSSESNISKHLNGIWKHNYKRRMIKEPRFSVDSCVSVKILYVRQETSYPSSFRIQSCQRTAQLDSGLLTLSKCHRSSSWPDSQPWHVSMESSISQIYYMEHCEAEPSVNVLCSHKLVFETTKFSVLSFQSGSQDQMRWEKMIKYKCLYILNYHDSVIGLGWCKKLK